MTRNKDNNIVYATLDELKKLKYKQKVLTKDKKGNIVPPEPGALLCLTNKAADLWAELSEIDIRISKVTGDKFFNTRKVKLWLALVRLTLLI